METLHLPEQIMSRMPMSGDHEYTLHSISKCLQKVLTALL